MPADPHSGPHFKGCHPEHEHGDDTPEGYQPQETEPCWHCGTPTPHGCGCIECMDDPYIGPAATYHCPTCGRWWAYMTGLNITTITIPGSGE